MSRAGPKEQTIKICESYRRRMAGGEKSGDIVASLAAIHGVQRPAIWRNLRSGGVLPLYAPRVKNGPGRHRGGGIPGFTARRREKEMEGERISAGEISAMPRVAHDPCSYCGVRADVGCRHWARL